MISPWSLPHLKGVRHPSLGTQQIQDGQAQWAIYHSWGHQCFKLLSMLRHRKATSLQKTCFNHMQRFSVATEDEENHRETGWRMFASKMTVIQMNVCGHMQRREVLHWLIDWVKVLHPTQHKICHFGDVPQANLLASYGKTKPNTTKAHIHQSKELYNNKK